MGKLVDGLGLDVKVALQQTQIRNMERRISSGMNLPLGDKFPRTVYHDPGSEGNRRASSFLERRSQQMPNSSSSMIFDSNPGMDIDFQHQPFSQLGSDFVHSGEKSSEMEDMEPDMWVTTKSVNEIRKLTKFVFPLRQHNYTYLQEVASQYPVSDLDTSTLELQHNLLALLGSSKSTGHSSAGDHSAVNESMEGDLGLDTTQ